MTSVNREANAQDILKAFISHDPNVPYTFDSERDSPQSEICREGGPRRRECIILQMNSKRLFQAMQDHGFFCALPNDPARTYMDCKPLPK